MDRKELSRRMKSTSAYGLIREPANITLETLASIAKALQVEPDYLIGQEIGTTARRARLDALRNQVEDLQAQLADAEREMMVRP